MVQVSCACGRNTPLSTQSGANQYRPDKNQNCPVKTSVVSCESRWANIRSRVSEENSRNRTLPYGSANQSGVSSEISGVFGNLSGESLGRNDGKRHGVVSPVKNVFNSRTACSFLKMSRMWHVRRYQSLRVRGRRTRRSFCFRPKEH